MHLNTFILFLPESINCTAKLLPGWEHTTAWVKKVEGFDFKIDCTLMCICNYHFDEMLKFNRQTIANTYVFLRQT